MELYEKINKKIPDMKEQSKKNVQSVLAYLNNEEGLLENELETFLNEKFLSCGNDNVCSYNGLFNILSKKYKFEMVRWHIKEQCKLETSTQENTYINMLGFEIYHNLISGKENEYIIFYHKVKIGEFSYLKSIKVIKSVLKQNGVSLELILKEVCGFNVDSIDTKQKRDSIIKSWFDETELIDGVNYYPDKNVKFISIKGKKIPQLNTYIEPDLDFLPKEMSTKGFPNLKQIIDNLVGFDNGGFNWICNWVAGIFQNPVRKVPTAIIFQGVQGTGKGLFSSVMRKLLQENFFQIGLNEMDSDYNGWLFGRLLVIGNEIKHYENKLTIPDKLKNWVTDEFVSIREMYKPPYIANNYARFIFNSNHLLPLSLEKSDRRYSTFKSPTKLENKYYLQFKANEDMEISNFLSYLKSIDIDWTLISSPYINQARKDLISLSQNSMDMFLERVTEIGGFDKMYHYLNQGESLVNSDFQVYTKPDGLYIEGRIIYETYVKFCKSDGYKNHFAQRLFTAHLEQYGFKLKVIKVNSKSMRAFNISNVRINP